MRLEDRIGNLQPGSDADFLVLDYNATPLMSYRLQQSKNIAETLFVLMTLGDDRTVKETWAAHEHCVLKTVSVTCNRAAMRTFWCSTTTPHR